MFKPVFILPMLACGLFMISGLTALISWKRISGWLVWPSMGLLGAAAFFAWLEVQRLPVYGRFEANLHMALVLALCVAFIGRRHDIVGIQPWGRFLVAALLGFALIGSEGQNPDYYMYQFLSVQLFFFLRLSAGGVLFFACILYTSIWFRLLVSRQNNETAGLRLGSIALILGSILFLGSEFAGTIWCALGWGDTWHWSRNFFKSASMFLLLMLPLHLPRWLKKNVRLAGAGSLCTLAVILEIAL